MRPCGLWVYAVWQLAGFWHKHSSLGHAAQPDCFQDCHFFHHSCLCFGLDTASKVMSGRPNCKDNKVYNHSTQALLLFYFNKIFKWAIWYLSTLDIHQKPRLYKSCTQLQHFESYTNNCHQSVHTFVQFRSNLIYCRSLHRPCLGMHILDLTRGNRRNLKIKLCKRQQKQWKPCAAQPQQTTVGNNEETRFMSALRTQTFAVTEEGLCEWSTMWWGGGQIFQMQ